MNKPKHRVEITNSVMFVEALTQHHDLCAQVLETLLKIKIDRIEKIVPEAVIHGNIDTVNPRLDIYAESNNKMIDIEMQLVKRPDILKRMRYYQACMDEASLPRGTSNYNLLKESFIVFLCGFDPFVYGKTIYNIERCFTNFNSPIEVGSQDHWVLFNFSNWQNCPVDTGNTQKLLKYFATGNPSNDQLTSRLDEVVDSINTDPKKVNEMWTVEDEKKLIARETREKIQKETFEKSAQIMIELFEQNRFDEIERIKEDPRYLEELIAKKQAEK